MAEEFLGPYRIERVLGRGGMGTVYAAVDEQSGRRVAVKALSGAYLEEDHFRDRFEAEIETLKKLQHPNIVEMYGYGEQQGQPFFSMELVEGRSLHDELKSGRRFDWRQVVQIGVDICAALKHAHDRGVIHRDLKPANILLSDQGVIKLTDFGIAKLFGASSMTAHGSVIGTADFMSPEQARGRPVAARSDLYSLGSVLYTLLARRAPFADETLPQVIEKLCHQPPPPLKQFILGVPSAVEEVLRSLLEKEPSNRPATARAAANRLRAAELMALAAMEEFQHKPATHPSEKAEDLGETSRAEDMSGGKNEEDDNADFSVIENPTPNPLKTITPGSVEDVATRPRDSLENSGFEIEPPTAMGSDQAPDDMQDDELRLAPLDEAPQTGRIGASSLGRQQPSRQTGQQTGRQKTGLEEVDGTVLSQGRGQQTHPSESGAAGGKRGRTTTHFTLVDEETRRRAQSPILTEGPTAGAWLRIAALGAAAIVATVALAAAGYYAFRPPSADRLFGRISEAADREDGRGLLSVSAEMEQFLKLYPNDDRAEEVRQFQEELDLLKLQRKFDLQLRGFQRGRRISPAQSAYLQTLEMAKTHPEVAAKRMEALIELFQADPNPSKETRLVLELARARWKQLQKSIADYHRVHLSLLKKRLRQADSLKEENPQAAKRIWRSIVTFYSDRPWAQEWVDQARQELRQVTMPTNTGSTGQRE